MKLHLSVIIFLFVYVSAKLVDCQQSTGSSVATTQRPLITDDDVCPLWHHFNTTTNLCECNISSSIDDLLKCTKNGVRLRVGLCMTYADSEEDQEGSPVIYIAQCRYFIGNISTSDNGRFVELSVKNASKLNDVMCDPMNRKGTLCSECKEDDHGPSVISLGLVCSNCTGVWYGIPLYLFLEFVPITVFYFIILFFRVNLTSAPMVAFVFYSQIIISTFLAFGINLKFETPAAYYFTHAFVTFYGFLNLDFFRFILPPFCVSSHLKNMHIIAIDYVSAFYPLCLICITWIAIKLHFWNFKPVVWLWSKLRKFSCMRTQSRNQSNSLIDVFTTFFLLSFSKLVYTSTSILTPLKAMAYANNTLSRSYRLAGDPRIEFFGIKEHLKYALASIMIVMLLILPPVILLIVYPIKMFRLLLFKCHLSTRTLASLNIFVEKYYSCYRDGREGGRDMRSLASMYFIIRVLSILIFQVTSLNIYLTFDIILYMSYGIVIALVRPYKKTYMNVIDTLIMANLSLLALMVNKLYFEDSLALLYVIIIAIFNVLPLLSLTGFIGYRILKRIKSELVGLSFRTKMESKKHSSKTTAIAQQEDLSNDPELPDRLLHPQQYDLVKMTNFEGVNYVKAR